MNCKQCKKPLHAKEDTRLAIMDVGRYEKYVIALHKDCVAEFDKTVLLKTDDAYLEFTSENIRKIKKKVRVRPILVGAVCAFFFIVTITVVIDSGKPVRELVGIVALITLILIALWALLSWAFLLSVKRLRELERLH